MSRFRRRLRQTLTIARRDFIATVFTPIFLLFLLAPLIMASLGAIGGLGAASAAGSAGDTARIVVIAAPANRDDIAGADRELRRLFRNGSAPPELRIDAPAGAIDKQARALFAKGDVDVVAALSGPLNRPRILYSAAGGRAAEYLAVLAEQTLQARSGSGDLSQATREAVARTTASRGGRNQSAFLAVFGVFFLTLFLAGQVVGTMAEERNNKVIEVLAAAVPLESVFFGKLLGMFGVAVLFVAFWAVVGSQAIALMPGGASRAMAELQPAVGRDAFILLFAAYFAMAYLLLGSVFLGIGAQASTMREIQMLSLPITLVQVGMFALSSAAASQPGTRLALVAEVFPLSSPFAMAGRAANAPELWPHLAALAWQGLWVAIFITVGARLFRRGVLQSGSTGVFGRMFRRSRRGAVDTPAG